MPTVKISELTNLTTANPSDVLAIVNAGATKKITVSNLVNSAGDITITGDLTARTGSFHSINVTTTITASNVSVDANTLFIGGEPFNKANLENLKAGKPIATDLDNALVSQRDDTTYIRTSAAGRMAFYAGNVPVLDLQDDEITIGSLAGGTGVPISFTGPITGSIQVTGSAVTENPQSTTSSLFSIYLPPDYTDVEFNALDVCGNILINCEANILHAGNIIDTTNPLIAGATRMTATFGIGNRNFGYYNLIAGASNEISSSTGPRQSTALGQSNKIYGDGTINAFAAGFNNKVESAISFGAFAHGDSNLVDARFYGHAEGSNTTASGDYAHSEGMYTQAIGKASHAAGTASISVGNYSYAGGIGTVASGSGQTVIGKYNSHNNTDPLFIIGFGEHDTARRDLATFALDSIFLNSYITASSGLDISSSITFTANDQHLRGTLSGSNTVRNIIGLNDTNQVEVGNSTGNQVHLIGHVTASQTIRNADGTASGLYAVSLGGLEADNTASGDYSIAIGPRAKATNNSTFSHLGNAFGAESAVLGGGTANAPSSIALAGEANGTGSRSLTAESTAVANYSVALGEFNTTTGPATGSVDDPVYLVIGNGLDGTNQNDLILFRSQSIILDTASLPTTDPSNVGQLWRSGSVGNETHLMISLG